MDSYPPATLAPDPDQLELDLKKPPSDAAQRIMRRDFGRRFADQCRWCGSIHLSSAERAQCQLDNT